MFQLVSVLCVLVYLQVQAVMYNWLVGSFIALSQSAARVKIATCVVHSLLKSCGIHAHYFCLK